MDDAPDTFENNGDVTVLTPGEAFARARRNYVRRRATRAIAVAGLSALALGVGGGMLKGYKTDSDVRVATRGSSGHVSSTTETTRHAGPNPSSAASTPATPTTARTGSSPPGSGTTPASDSTPSTRSLSTYYPVPTTPKATTTTTPTTITSPTSTTLPPVVGDINGDGNVGCKDFAIMQAEWQETGSNLSADLNSDGTVDVFDLSILSSHWTGDGDTSCQQP